ncbi:glycosyltransferase family 9 protein, partial [Vibrio sp. D173a]|uniref:glycosyltransferase family 9 protein n=1 Tax=Vibrio sp. D173a TaxID=2836349 RepID=UPI0025530C4A
MPLFTQAPESVCFLRLSAIGDVCHAVAAVQALQKQWPTTKVTWIIGKVEAQLLEGLEGVELIVFDKKAGFSGMQAVWKKLSDRKFDALVHMQLALRASLLTLGIKANHKVGFNFKRAKEAQWLFTNKKIEDVQSQHVLDSFYSFVEYLGVPSSIPAWNLPIGVEDTLFAKESLGSNPTVVISPAASKDERNWLPERYAEFADYAVSQGYQVAICGSPAEREMTLAKVIMDKMTHPA